MSPEAAVLRFSPIAPERMLKKAEQAFRDCGAYRLSVFAADAQLGESEVELIDRILRATELGGIDPITNTRYWYLSKAEKIYELGYNLVKYGFDGEIEEHYSIDLGNSATIEDTTRIQALFSPRKRRDE